MVNINIHIVETMKRDLKKKHVNESQVHHLSRSLRKLKIV